MKLKIALLAVCLTLVISFLMSSCTASTDKETSTDSHSEESFDNSSYDEVSFADESSEDLSKLEISVNFTTYIEDETDFLDREYAANMVYSSVQVAVSEEVADFKYIRVFYDENGDPYSSGALYEAELLTPDNSFRAQTYIRERFSNRGISYVDDNGKVCYALIGYDENGTLSTIPFDNFEREEKETTVHVPEGDALVSATISFDGTAEGIISALVNLDALPQGTSVNHFYTMNGVAHIDLDQTCRDYLMSTDESLGFGCVVNSLLEYYGDKGIERVLITADDKLKGKSIFPYFGKEDDGKHYATISLFDVYALDLYPYPVSYDGTIDGLIAALVKESGWNSDIKVNSFEIKNGKAYIDLNEAFGNHVYAGLFTESGVTCVVSTLLDNYEIYQVIVTIEGEPFVSDYH